MFHICFDPNELTDFNRSTILSLLESDLRAREKMLSSPKLGSAISRAEVTVLRQQLEDYKKSTAA